MKAYTDYPFVELGDEPYKEAPVRQVEIVSYDFNKYCYVRTEGYDGLLEVKTGYLHKKCSKNKVTYIRLSKRDLHMLPSSNPSWPWTYTDWLERTLRHRPSVHKQYNIRYCSFKELLAEQQFKHKYWW